MEVDIHVEVIEVITVGLFVHIRISNHASNNMTLSTGQLLSTERYKIPLEGGVVEVDILIEVIEVITVGLLIHIRITNHPSNNMTLSTGAISTESCKITLGGERVEVDIHVLL